MEQLLIFHNTFKDIGIIIKEKLPIQVIPVSDREDAIRALPDSDFMMVSTAWEDSFLCIASKLKWIQATSTGVEYFSKDKLKGRGIKLTNASGINVVPASEHAIGLMFAFARNFHLARDAQLQQRWERDRLFYSSELHGKTLVILCLGNIGVEIAKRARALGMHCIGIKRDISEYAEHVDELLPPSQLQEAVSRADFFILTCPSTPETEGMVDKKILNAMKETAFLINISRGSVVVEEDLIDALEKKHIAGAGLDVFTQEPLSKENRLWDFPHVFITPHIAGTSRDNFQRLADLFIENYHRFHAGEKLIKSVL